MSNTFYIITTGILNNDGVYNYINLYNRLYNIYRKRILNAGFSNIVVTHYEDGRISSRHPELVQQLTTNGHQFIDRYFNPIIDLIPTDNHIIIDFAHIFLYTSTPGVVTWNVGAENDLPIDQSSKFKLHTLYTDYLANYTTSNYITSNMEYNVNLLENGFDIINGKVVTFVDVLIKSLPSDITVESMQLDSSGQCVGIGYAMWLENKVTQ